MTDQASEVPGSKVAIAIFIVLLINAGKGPFGDGRVVSKLYIVFLALSIPYGKLASSSEVHSRDLI